MPQIHRLWFKKRGVHIALKYNLNSLSNCVINISVSLICESVAFVSKANYSPEFQNYQTALKPQKSHYLPSSLNPVWR